MEHEWPNRRQRPPSQNINDTYELPALLFAATLLSGNLEAVTCESIASLKLPDTSITMTRNVAAGEFSGPENTPTASQEAEFRKLPAFCRVQGVIRPSSDSNIDFEVWMPISGWNGRYLGVGNGGFAGSINYFSANGNAPSMAQALAAGYATSSTDTGHKAAIIDADWAVGHPEKVIDYGYRAVHATAVDAKKIIGAFYSKQPTSYFSSCSNGGRQALMEAQRYPADYAGIVAGDPAWYATHLAAAQIWNQQAIMANQDSYVPAGKFPAITAAVLDKCDELDGVKDGVIDDPRKCHFDPAVLLCKGGDSDTCLTGPQVEGLKKIYAGPTNSSRSADISRNPPWRRSRARRLGPVDHGRPARKKLRLCIRCWWPGQDRLSGSRRGTFAVSA